MSSGDPVNFKRRVSSTEVDAKHEGTATYSLIIKSEIYICCISKHENVNGFAIYILNLDPWKTPQTFEFGSLSTVNFGSKPCLRDGGDAKIVIAFEFAVVDEALNAPSDDLSCSGSSSSTETVNVAPFADAEVAVKASPSNTFALLKLNQIFLHYLH